MDVHEDKEKNAVTATFELPGLKKEDVQIDIQNNVLTVAGEVKADEQREEHGYAVRERRFGRFSRSIPVPQGIKVRVSCWSGMRRRNADGTCSGGRSQGGARRRRPHCILPTHRTGDDAKAHWYRVNDALPTPNRNVATRVDIVAVFFELFQFDVCENMSYFHTPQISVINGQLEGAAWVVHGSI
jgi:hypothetical protein